MCQNLISIFVKSYGDQFVNESLHCIELPLYDCETLQYKSDGVGIQSTTESVVPIRETVGWLYNTGNISDISGTEADRRLFWKNSESEPWFESRSGH